MNPISILKKGQKRLVFEVIEIYDKPKSKVVSNFDKPQLDWDDYDERVRERLD